MSYDEIPCPHCKSNLYFPGTSCADCGYSDKEGVTPEGFRRVEAQNQRHQIPVDFQALYARGIQQPRSTTPPTHSHNKEWLTLFDATYGPLRPRYQDFKYEHTKIVGPLDNVPAADSSCNQLIAPRDTAFEDTLSKLRERSRERVAARLLNARRGVRCPKQKAQRPAPAEKVVVSTHVRQKLSRAEYVTRNTYELVSKLIDDVSLSVIQGFLCDHYDANRRGKLSRCKQIRAELAHFLNTLQAAKLQQPGKWDSRLLAQFLIERA